MTYLAFAALFWVALYFIWKFLELAWLNIVVLYALWKTNRVIKEYKKEASRHG